MSRTDSIEELRRVTNAIPPGSVLNYGGVGQAMVPRQTGRAVGRLLSLGAEGVAWWRVVRNDGYLSVANLDSLTANRQAELLRAEGVEVRDFKVEMSKYRCEVDSVTSP